MAQQQGRPRALLDNARRALEVNDLAAAAGYAQQCVALRPGDPHPLCVLGEIRMFEGRFTEAAEAYDRALALAPQHDAAVVGKADALERSGDCDAARALLAPLLVAGDRTPGLAVVQARLDLREGNLDAVVALAASRLAEDRLDAHERAHLGFLMGQALERAGRHDEAFEAYSRANRAIAVPYDAGAWPGRIDELIEVCSAERMSSLPRAMHRSELPVFIVGMPRSGSTLVESIVAAHPRAFGAGEFEGIHRIVSSIWEAIGSTLPYPACLQDLEPDDVETLSRRYVEPLAAKCPEATRILDKALANYCHLGLIALLFPGARIIHCRRDPLDTCLSCFAQPLWPSAHPYACDLEDLGVVYAGYDRLMRHWHSVLDLPILDVQYEQLVAEAERVSREIVEFCGLEWDPGCLRYYQTGRVALTASYDQVDQPIYDRSVGRHRHFERHLGNLRQVLAEAGCLQ